MVEIFSKYNLPPIHEVFNNEPSLTQQQFAAECDINNIMARYQETGLLYDPLNPGTQRPMFDDFASSTDYHEAQNIIAYAQQEFEALPSKIRLRFNNDPGELLQFLEKEENRNEAIHLGLVGSRLDASSTGGTDGSLQVDNAAPK